MTLWFGNWYVYTQPMITSGQHLSREIICLYKTNRKTLMGYLVDHFYHKLVFSIIM